MLFRSTWVLTTGDRILLINQALKEENGIYVYNGAGQALTRAGDANSNDLITNGLYTLVTEGNSYKATGWILTTPSPIVLGTTHLTFVQFTGTGGLTAGNGIQFSGRIIRAVSANVDNIDISSAGIDLAPIGPGYGIYNRVTVDAFGRVVAAESINYLTDNNIINVVGDATGSGRTTINLTLASTGVTQGLYTTELNKAPVFNVDNHGRLTYAGLGNITVTSSNITDFAEAVQDVIGGSINLDPSTGIETTYNDQANTYTLSLRTTGVAAGTYGDDTHTVIATVDAQGRITDLEEVLINFPVKSVNGANGDVLVDESGFLTVDKYAVGLGNVVNELQVVNAGGVPRMLIGTTATRPANDATTPGTLFINTDTFAIERDTGVAWTTIRPAVAGDVAIPAGFGSSVLSNTGVTAGTYTKVLVDAKGRVLTGSQVANSDIVAGLGYTPVNKAGDTMSGQLTLPVGALNGPSLNFNGSSLTGLYSPGTDSIAIVTNGVARQRVTSTGRTLFGTGSDNNVDLVQVFGNIKANDPTNSSHVATKNYVDTSISNAIAISTTDDVDEGYANLYYTDTRVRNALSVSGNLTYNAVTGVFGYVTPNTDGITEGSTNKYYTDRKSTRLNSSHT